MPRSPANYGTASVADYVGPLLLPADWCVAKGIDVLDPDGWRDGVSGLPDGVAYPPATWVTLITEAEFDARAAHSTTGPRDRRGPRHPEIARAPLANPRLLSGDEQACIDRLEEAWGLLRRIIGNGPNASNDLAELIVPLHTLQNAVLAQAAARAYPTVYRRLGETTV